MRITCKHHRAITNQFYNFLVLYFYINFFSDSIKLIFFIFVVNFIKFCIGEIDKIHFNQHCYFLFVYFFVCYIFHVLLLQFCFYTFNNSIENFLKRKKNWMKWKQFSITYILKLYKFRKLSSDWISNNIAAQKITFPAAKNDSNLHFQTL